MRKPRFSEEQIIGILQEHPAGGQVSAVPTQVESHRCRKTASWHEERMVCCCALQKAERPAESSKLLLLHRIALEKLYHRSDGVR